MNTIYNFFLGNSFRGSGLDLVRARAFIAFNCILIGLFFSHILFRNYVLETSDYIQKFNLVVNLALILIYFSCLMTIRFTGHLFLPANFSIFWTILILCLLSYLSGGPVDSYIIWICWLPVLIAFIFAGRKSGIFWGLVSLIFYTFMLILHIQNYKFAQLIEQEPLRLGLISTWYIGFSAISVLAFYANQMLTTLDKSRNGNFDLIHQYIKTKNSYKNIPYELVENYLYHAVDRNNAYGDKLVLITVSLQTETGSHLDNPLVFDETLTRILKLVRSTDLAVQLDNGYIAILIENIISTDSANALKDSLSQSLHKPYYNNQNKPLTVRSHIAAHIYPDEGADIDSMTALLRRKIRH